MNRLTFLLKAKTEYYIHSPYVFRLYMSVIKPNSQDFAQLAHSLAEWAEAEQEDLADDHAEIRNAEGEFYLMRHPHASKEAEHRFDELQRQYPVSIDLYHAAVLIRNPKLHPQRFLLR